MQPPAPCQLAKHSLCLPYRSTFHVLYGNIQHSIRRIDVSANRGLLNPAVILSPDRDGCTYPDIGQCRDGSGAIQEDLQQVNLE
uniref:Uncharacterized protein n=1 Tax=Romanomermis culicivorax TaxID=13658 RepID=A0A915IWB2_ROMCU